MKSFGSCVLVLALLLNGYHLLAGIIGIRRKHHSRTYTPIWLEASTRIAGMSSFVVVSAAAGALVWAALRNDFSLLYVANHSNRDLPAAYKFAALWSGQEGSLLLWAWLLGGYGFLVIRRHPASSLAICASTVIAGIQVFFLLLLNIAARPFSQGAGPVPRDGLGLNPLLQYPEMVVHPPLLYLGYVGFSVPFAFTLGGLLMDSPDSSWIRISRRWMMVTWLFLTGGIFLGSHWAYSVLGWGGYWGWDPVENASLMPWLTSTAFLHAAIAYEKRGIMKRWSVWLVFATFLLSILGTLLTRSGALSSVHSFAQSSLGLWFWIFLAIVMMIFVAAYIQYRDRWQDSLPPRSIVSRESSLLFNNVLFVAMCFVVLWGTLFPVVSEHLQGERIVLGPPFFNGAVVPAGLALLGLMGIGPLLAWRTTSLQALGPKLTVPMGIGLATAILLLVLGLGPTREGGHWFSFLTWIMAATVASSIVHEFLRGALAFSKHASETFLRSLIRYLRYNNHRYSGYAAHFGIVTLFAGIAGSAFDQTATQELALHQSMTIGAYRLECLDYAQDRLLNYDTSYALLRVYRGTHNIAFLKPERRVYIASGQPMTMVANYSTLATDLYVVYAGREPDTQHPIFKVFLNPLVAWVWIGMGIVILGSLSSLLSRQANTSGTHSIMEEIK